MSDLLPAVFGCEEDALRLLDHADVNFRKLVGRMVNEGVPANFENLVTELFRLGVSVITEAYDDIRSFSEDGMERDLLRLVDPYGDDFTFHIDRADSHIIGDGSKKEVYETLFSAELAVCERITGIPIEWRRK